MACMFPFYVQDALVPCGKCPSCLVRRTDSWIFRLTIEELSSQTSSWITLTYDDEHLPRSGNNLPTLRKDDFQRFMKRLRKLHPVSSPRIRYYCAGEYGTNHRRPHYHVLLLDVNETFIADAWLDKDRRPFGSIFIADDKINSNNIAYTVGYMCKPRSVRLGYRDDREPEFSLMSKKLGLSFITPEIIQYYKDDLSRSDVFINGKRSALPRYFADKIFSKSDKELRSALLETDSRRAALAVYREHIHRKGDASQFIHEQNERRHAAVRNFQSKFKNRE